MAELARHELWIPGQGHSLNGEYPVPPPEELIVHWEGYSGESGNTIEAPGVYGVISVPKTRPTAYASVDLCEVVRQTSLTLRTVEGELVDAIECIHHYAEGMQSITPDDIMPVVQALMANGHIPPVEGIDTIRQIMAGWKASGVYIVANTSTLPGCETGTIAFFNEHLPGIFDGILLPRNHDGSHPVTKGVAARNLLEYFGEGGGDPTVAVHIDDLAHHNVGFRAAVGEIPGVAVRTFQPLYPSHFELDYESTHAPDPVTAFAQADAFLQDYLRAQ